MLPGGGGPTGSEWAVWCDRYRWRWCYSLWVADRDVTQMFSQELPAVLTTAPPPYCNAVVLNLPTLMTVRTGTHTQHFHNTQTPPPFFPAADCSSSCVRFVCCLGAVRKTLAWCKTTEWIENNVTSCCHITQPASTSHHYCSVGASVSWFIYALLLLNVSGVLCSLLLLNTLTLTRQTQRGERNQLPSLAWMKPAGVSKGVARKRLSRPNRMDG